MTGWRRRRSLVTIALAAALAGGCGSGPVDVSAGPDPVPPTSGPTTTTAPTGPATTDSIGPGPAPALPTGLVPDRIVIPAIDLDAATLELDLRGLTPEVPQDFDDTGWYQQTRRPGEIGPAVIAGHIDSVAGPAVFARLDELTVGDEIIVHGEGGATRIFAVTGHGRYPKDELPAEVFGFGRATPELRLITCGGVFDRRTGHYRDNYVVYAEGRPS